MKGGRNLKGINRNKFLAVCILSILSLITVIVVAVMASSIPKPETIQVFLEYLFNNTQAYMAMLLVTVLSFISCVGSDMAGVSIAIDYLKGNSVYYEEDKVRLIIVVVFSILSACILIGYIVRYLFLLLVAPAFIILIFKELSK